MRRKEKRERVSVVGILAYMPQNLGPNEGIPLMIQKTMRDVTSGYVMIIPSSQPLNNIHVHIRLA